MTPRTRPFARMLTALNAQIMACLFASPALAAGFSSPSGNIRCYVDLYNAQSLDEVPMVCLVFAADWDLPPDYGDDDPTCDLDRTRTVILTHGQSPVARWTCHGDVFWPAPLGKISYGSQWSLFDFTCDMAMTGVRCDDGQGHGFAVNSAGVMLN